MSLAGAELGLGLAQVDLKLLLSLMESEMTDEKELDEILRNWCGMVASQPFHSGLNKHLRADLLAWKRGEKVWCSHMDGTAIQMDGHGQIGYIEAKFCPLCGKERPK